MHPPEYLQAPSVELFDRFWQAARGTVRLITIAPELPGALELITHAASLGVRVSLGHSDATAVQARAGIDAGGVSATHTYNAMRGLEHREPGMLGVVLDDQDLYAEIIADGKHVDPVAVRIFWREKGAARAILITDGLSATGMPEGHYTLGGFDVEVKDGVGWHNGIVAGSVLTMDRAVRNFADFTARAALYSRASRLRKSRCNDRICKQPRSHRARPPCRRHRLLAARTARRHLHRGPLRARAMTQRTAIIIGAGPAGLTAALELLRRGGKTPEGAPAICPIVLEADDSIGGISRTIRYKGNRMDIGGHRFFSKSDRVMQWWLDLMPIADEGAGHAVISYQNRHRSLKALHVHTQPDADPELVMLVRPRRSRIYFLRRFFDYPITLTADTLSKLGLARTAQVGLSYIKSRLHQRRPEKSLEDFLINRFGRQLYLTFFKSYTEKVWGVRCDQISAEWGAQRIKGLSLTRAVTHFLKRAFTARSKDADLAQKHTETSLIEQFLYPMHGPGQLWEHVADLIRQQGGEVLTGWRVDRMETDGAHRVVAVEAQNKNGERRRFAADYCFSTMPVVELVRALDQPAPANVREVVDGLMYRDFITVGLLLDRLLVTEPDGSPLKDTWIYVQEPDVLLGRLQIFNNWSPHMVADPSKVWIGLEYFCYETDELWRMPDDEIIRFATRELAKIGIIDAADVRDGHVVRVPKTYPAYFGTYDRFGEIREWLDPFENLFLVGRNGMHKYNNQDHSMLTAMTAVDNILAGITDKSTLWEINTEQDYHEEK